MPKYRVTHYLSGYYSIEKQRVRGNKSKNPGKGYWVNVTYPVTVGRVAYHLLHSQLPIDESWLGADEMVAAIKEAQAKIEKMINEEIEWRVVDDDK